MLDKLKYYLSRMRRDSHVRFFRRDLVSLPHQLAPGEYFFTSFKITLYTGLLLSSPIIIYQIIRFAAPGLTLKEKQVIIPILTGGLFLFFMGIIFGYYILIPAALTFFINYGAEVIEPLWSFEQYCDFILLLLCDTKSLISWLRKYYILVSFYLNKFNYRYIMINKDYCLALYSIKNNLIMLFLTIKPYLVLKVI